MGGKAQAPPGGLTARLLRKVRLGESARFTRKFLQWYRERLGDTGFLPEHLLGRQGLAPPEKTTIRRRGRKGMPDLFYARIARDYAKAINRGGRQPITDVAEAKRLPRNKVRDMVHQARERGLLTDGIPGRPIGQLTQKGMMLLRASQHKGGKPNARINR